MKFQAAGAGALPRAARAPPVPRFDRGFGGGKGRADAGQLQSLMFSKAYEGERAVAAQSMRNDGK